MANYPTRAQYPSSRSTATKEEASVAQVIQSTETMTASQAQPEAPEIAHPAQSATNAASTEPQADATDTQVSTAQAQPGVTLSVITGNSDARVAQIILGTVGTVKNDIFEIDAIYTKVAYLFTLTSASMTGQGTVFQDVTLPNQAAAQEFIINMVASSGDRWDKRYTEIGGNQSEDMVTKMIINEKNMMRQNVARVLSESGLKSFDVPVKYEAFVSQPDDDETAEECNLFTEIDLATAGVKANLSIELIAGAPIEESSENAPDSADLNAQALAHKGAFHLDVKGVAKILASSSENAQAIFSSLLQISNSNPVQNVLTVKPVSLDNIRLTPYQSNNDYERGGY